MAAGTWLNAGTAKYPAVVLGADTADRLGVAAPNIQVWLGAQWFTVVGILEPNELVPEVDSTALVGWDAAVAHLGFDGHPTTIYTRAREDAVENVRNLLAATANPQARPRWRSAARPTRSPRRTPPTRRSPACSSASAASHCWSAASASPTRW